MLTDYTTYDDVRAALGVSAEDIDDATLALRIYSNHLDGDLDDIALTLATTFADTKTLPTPTPIQSRFLRACELFATYSVAKQLTAALPLFAAAQVGDGKAVVQRFDNPYRETIKSVNEQYGKTRNRLIAALALVGTASSAPVASVYMSVASPSVDPVTGS